MSRRGPFVHLDVRSYFSLKDGAFSPEELATRAAELGMPAVAMTDRDGLYGAARFVDACTKVGFHPILGATLTLLPDGEVGSSRLEAAGGGRVSRGRRRGGPASRPSWRSEGRP
ncbi:MAG: PHP domain-containing protein, partial [Actinomycetota bacterium]|nr:PHP domain-containing protein [Actinomycetota bacterium]